VQRSHLGLGFVRSQDSASVLALRVFLTTLPQLEREDVGKSVVGCGAASHPYTFTGITQRKRVSLKNRWFGN